MRKYFFYIVVFAFLLIGILLLVKKSDFNDFLDSWGNNSIAPRNEWRDILIGKWGFTYLAKNTENIINVTSEVEYFPDNKFTRRVILKIYSSEYEGEEVKEKKSDLCNQITGTVKGSWSISDTLNLWYEKIDSCNFNPPYKGDHGCKNIDACSLSLFKKGTKRYGDRPDGDYVTTLKVFNENKILIIGKSISMEGTHRTIGKKIK